MKKIALFVSAITALAFVSVSCNDDPLPPTDPTEENVELTFTVDNPTDDTLDCHVSFAPMWGDDATNLNLSFDNGSGFPIGLDFDNDAIKTGTFEHTLNFLTADTEYTLEVTLTIQGQDFVSDPVIISTLVAN